MRLALYRRDGEQAIGVALPAGGILRLDPAARRILAERQTAWSDRPGPGSAEFPSSLPALLAAGPTVLSELEGLAAWAARQEFAELTAIDVASSSSDTEFLPTLAGATRLICVGQNYRSAARQRFTAQGAPALFTRFWSSLVGHGSPLLVPPYSEQLDVEGELAVVIGRHCRHVSRDQARDVIAGYTIVQEGSIRDWQRHSASNFAGKNFYHSGAMGPWFVTASDVPDAQRLAIEVSVNGQLRQHGSTSDMLNDISGLIAYVTRFTPLAPGDVLCTGTPERLPAGPGSPWLRSGDVVRVQIEGLGTLENPVADDVLPPPHQDSTGRHGAGRDGSADIRAVAP